jgi:hypothetical protein
VGTLAYKSPDHLEKRTTDPIQEQIVVDGDWLTYSKPAEDIHYTTTLENSRELRGLVEAVRATLAGDRASLERYYTVTLAGPIENWKLALVPAGGRLQGLLGSVTIFGQGAAVRRIDTVEANGDSSQMTIEPAPR